MFGGEGGGGGDKFVYVHVGWGGGSVFVSACVGKGGWGRAGGGRMYNGT